MPINSGGILHRTYLTLFTLIFLPLLSNGQVKLIRLSESKSDQLKKSGIHLTPAFDEPWMSFQQVTDGYYLVESPFPEEINPDDLKDILSFQINTGIPDDSAYFSQWNLRAIGFNLSMLNGLTLQPVRVAVLDTGIEPDHPDLTPSIWNNPGEGNIPDGIDNDRNGLTDDLIGYNFLSNKKQESPIDDHGHGTSVSGIIAAVTGNRIGIAGISPNAEILSLKVFDETGNGTELEIAKGLLYAWYMGAKVVNMSFGVSNDKSVLLESICSEMEKAGIILVASSGNSGGYDRHYPSGYESVISVGASGESGERTVFSMFGNRLDLLAPGSGIPTTALNQGYHGFSGTSASAPHVTAICAVLAGINPDLTTGQVRMLMQETAVKTGTDEFTAQSGAGVVNLTNAIYKIQNRYDVRISSPKTDDWWKGDSLQIQISTLTPNFKSWALYWKSGLGYPDDWKLITSSETRLAGENAATLFWDDIMPVMEPGDSVISIRLSVVNQNGSVLEDRKTVFRYLKPLKLDFSWIDFAWDKSGFSLWSEVQANHPVTLTLTAENSGQQSGNTNQMWKYTGFVSSPVFSSGAWNVTVKATDLAGDFIEFRKTVQVPELSHDKIEPDSVVLSGLPNSFLLSKNCDWNRDGVTDFVVSLSDENSEYGAIRFYNGKNLSSPQDSISLKLVPKDVLYWNGKWWFLGLSLGQSFLYSSVTDSTPPVALSWQSSKESETWASGLAIKEGKLFLIWRNSASYRISEFNSTGTQTVKTQVGAYPQTMKLSGPPNSRVVRFTESFNGPQLFVADQVGNALVYQWDDRDTLLMLFADPVNLYEPADYLEAADLNQDGKDELILLSHDLQIEHPVYGETFPTRWNIRIYSEQDGKPVVLADQWFLNFMGESQRQNKLIVDSIDGDFFFLFGLHPDLLIGKWNSLKNQIEITARIENASMSSGFGKGNINGAWFDFISNPKGRPTAWNMKKADFPKINKVIQTSDSTAYLALDKTYPSVSLFRKENKTWDFRSYHSSTDTIRIKGSPDVQEEFLVGVNQSPVQSLRNDNHAKVKFWKSGELKTEVSGRLIQFHASQPMQFSSENFSDLLWKHNLPDRVLLDESGQNLVIRYPDSLSGLYPVPDFYDEHGRLFGKTVLTVNLPPLSSATGGFYIASCQSLSDYSAVITFSEVPDSLQLYSTPLPVSEKESITFEKQWKSEKSMLLSYPGRPAGSLGKPLVLDFSGLKSKDGPVINPAGSQVIIESTGKSVEDVLVYPNPWNMSKSGELYLGRLPQAVSISIYDIRFRLVTTIEKTAPGGSVSWNGKDRGGKTVSSGIYFYILKTPDGKEKSGKFAVIR